MSVLMTPAGKVLGISQSFATLLGHNADPAQSVFKAALWGDKPRAIEHLRQLVANCAQGIIIDESVPIHLASGDTGTLDLHLRPIISDDGDVSQIMCLATDKTELTKAQSDLQTSNSRFEEVSQRLVEADRRKDEFLATLAHELRNPLAPVLTGVELIKQLLGTSATIDNAIDIIERQTKQMSLLVDDLMDASRVSQGKFELKKQVINLDDLIRKAIETSRPSIDEAQHSLTLKLPEAPIWIKADSLRLSQVLINLLKNAAKFTRKSGKIHVSLQESSSGFVINVSDNGRGFSEDTIDSAFEMYTQLNKRPVNGDVGLGVGLALSRYLVNRHGGKLSVVSGGLNQGSTFSIALPLALKSSREGAKMPPVVNTWVTNERRSDESSRLLAAVSAPDVISTEVEKDDAAVIGKNSVVNSDATLPKVLIVDDNEDAAYILSELLEHLGVETEVVHTGADAITQFESFQPDMMLLDIGLPDMTGYAVARTIRQSSHWGKRARLVALTGLGGPEDKERSQQAGFNDHRVKPLSIVQLGPIVQQLKQLKSV